MDEWLSEADENDPIRHVFLKCKIHDAYNGNKAIYPYIVDNPHNIGLEEFSEYLLNLFDEIKALRGELIEIHEHVFLRNVLEHFDMKLSVSIEEAELIIMNGVSHAVPLPKTAEMLKVLKNVGIRTGIVSNLCWSGKMIENGKQIGYSFIQDNIRFDCAIRRLLWK